MHQDSVFPAVPCIPVLSEYMVRKEPETLLNEEKQEILKPAVSTTLVEIPCPLCCWVIMSICLKKRNLLGCSQRSCQSSPGMSILKNASAGLQGRQPIRNTKVCAWLKVKCRAAMFSNEARFNS